jgi:DNA-binding beta-propeller fold protein YncE
MQMYFRRVPGEGGQRQGEMLMRVCAGAGNRGVWLVVFAAAIIVAGCAVAPESAKKFEPPVYPPPPDTPRFVFEETLLSSAQVKREDREKRLRRLLTGEGETGKPFAKPFDVAVCEGRVYVSDTVHRTVLAFDFVNGRFFEIGQDEPGQLVKPLGLNTDGACNVYVADGTVQAVMVYDRDGVFRAAIGGKDFFDRLSHVAADTEGTRVFMVDTGDVESDNHRIRVFDVASGSHLYDIGRRGTGEGELNLPRDIEVGPDGRLYVVDGGNFRVQVFESDGAFVRAFGKVGRHFGQFSRPKGIASDRDGNVYVADAAFGNFQIFNPEGKLLLFIGARSNTPGPGKYLLPAGIDVDEDGRVYFVGQFFRKVDIFRPYSLAADSGYLRSNAPGVRTAGSSAVQPATGK